MIAMNRGAAAVALVVLVGLAGCHLTGGMSADLGEGRGRVDRTYKASLGRSTRATIDALDELKVQPRSLSIRAMESATELGKPGWVGQTNDEYFPNDQSFRELFDEHVLNVKGAESVPFNPVLVSYKGETADGRAVSVVVRAQPPDASQTLVMTRVGRNGDEEASRQLLDRITERMPGTAATPPAAAPASTSPAAASPAVPAATPPADLPALPG